MADTSGPGPVPWGTKTGWFVVHLVFMCSLQVSRMFMWWSSSALASSWPSCSGMASVALASTSWSQLFPCSGPLWCKASSTACTEARSTLAWRGRSTRGMPASVRFRCLSQHSCSFLSSLSMINADFCTGSVLISFGAVLGKTSPIQLLTMAIFEVTLFAVNEFVLLSLLGVRLSKAPIATWESVVRAFLWWITADLLVQTKDAGGSMTIHTFGAYFGLMVTRILYRPNLDKSKHRNSSVYHSDLFAMIGESFCSGHVTLPQPHTSSPYKPLQPLSEANLIGSPLLSGTVYLWMFWPSFNSAITAHGDDQHRTALNTYYSLAACTLATYGMSAITSHDGKLDMVRRSD